MKSDDLDVDASLCYHNSGLVITVSDFWCDCYLCIFWEKLWL